MSRFESDYVEKAFKYFVDGNHRMIVVLIGLETKKHIPTLHSRLGKFSSLQSIIWCYKNTGTAMDNITKKQKIADEDDSVVKWVKTNNPEHVLYKESGRVLGRTCDMLILQDFEAITPNMTVTCLETVRGGGLIVFLLDQDRSLSQLLGRCSDIHEGLGTNVELRFNKRLFKSLAQTDCTVFLDSKMKVMDVTKKIVEFGGRPANDTNDSRLIQHGDECVNDQSISNLTKLCKTADQRSVLESCIEIVNSSANAVVSITAARGRGKSASLGLMVAHAIHKGMPSVLISALFLENIQTLFELVIVGLQSLGYQRGTDFKVSYCFSGKKRSVTRIHLHKTKQFIEYFHPFEELRVYPGVLVIDEAASIPLNYVKGLLAVGLVFMASTVGGYEGTGGAFKIKLGEYLKNNSGPQPQNKRAVAQREPMNLCRGGFENRHCVSLELNEPIRYSKNDPVEKWLNHTLLLDAKPLVLKENPLPSECGLYYIDKNNLFCGMAETEFLLGELFAVFAASHYRNSPNDVQILADARNHEIFALLSPSNRVLCAIQVAFEGRVDRKAHSKEGSLIPWVIYENFHDEEFLGLLGIRIVRIAVHPSAYSMGYGTEALTQLINALVPESDLSRELPTAPFIATKDKTVLFNRIDSISIRSVIWVGASFGLTEKLLNFWKRREFLPICIKQTASRSTGEHSAIVLRCLSENLPPRQGDDALPISAHVARMRELFTQRLVPLLGYSLKAFPPTLCLSLVHASPRAKPLRRVIFSEDEHTRLKMFARGVVSVKNVLDIVPSVARSYFYGDNIEKISVLHQSVLIMVGCQFRDVEDVSRELQLEEFQINSILIKVAEVVLDSIEIE